MWPAGWSVESGHVLSINYTRILNHLISQFTCLEFIFHFSFMLIVANFIQVIE